MPDHKDLTNYGALPTFKMPPGSCRKLTSAECEAKAAETLADITNGRYADARDLRFLKRELRGWHRLAAERD